METVQKKETEIERYIHELLNGKTIAEISDALEKRYPTGFERADMMNSIVSGYQNYLLERAINQLQQGMNDTAVLYSLVEDHCPTEDAVKIIEAAKQLEKERSFGPGTNYEKPLNTYLGADNTAAQANGVAGADNDTAEQAYDSAGAGNTAEQAVYSMEEINYLRKRAFRSMMTGFLICIVGVVVTFITYNSASETGGRYAVFWGAIIFGAIQGFRGLANYSKLKI